MEAKKVLPLLVGFVLVGGMFRRARQLRNGGESSRCDPFGRFQHRHGHGPDDTGPEVV